MNSTASSVATTMPAESTAFFICTEAGKLEAESLLLCRSLRHFGGRFATAPIISVQPRKGPPLARETREAFRTLDITHIEAQLNSRYAYYPLANKPLSGAFLERHFDFETLVFLDSDMVFLAEPAELYCPAGVSATVRPVHRKFFGTSACDRHAENWSRLFKALGVTSRFRSVSTLDGEDLVGYWNSGMVAARRDAGLFSLWARTLGRIIDESLLPADHYYFFEQMSLAAAIHAHEGQPRILPRSYNYPLPYDHDFTGSGGPAFTDWNDIVSIHYHRMFQRPGLRHPLDRLRIGATDSRQSQWIRVEADRAGLYPAAEPAILVHGLRLWRRQWHTRLSLRFRQHWNRGKQALKRVVRLARGRISVMSSR